MRRKYVENLLKRKNNEKADLKSNKRRAIKVRVQGNT